MFRKKKCVSMVDSCHDNYFRRIKKTERKYFRKQFCIRYLPVIFVLFFSRFNFFAVLLSAALWFVLTMFFDHRLLSRFSPVVRVWFGVPGAGKTSVAAWLTRNSKKKGITVLSNVEIADSYRLDTSDLGTVDMSFDGKGCHVVYDEAGIDFDNRNFTDFAKSNKPKYFALHRHQCNMVDVFSQAYDIDKRIRDRTSHSGLFYLFRLPIPGFVGYRRIKKVFLIKKDDKQMIDGFDFYGLPRFLYVRSVWDSFDTLDMSVLGDLQSKDWKKWDHDNLEIE